ncbi:MULTISPECIES: hypothetical protein [Spartinivicinus]|uniref:Uncharacterized protein n=1 Tax=Spartinivicinus poritis TaxID=2994640 RepID=A0ABT5U974_9GAMM|nr:MULTISPECIES: hypothetical protein [Spartinivicinus]MDE1462102.1 hypothetical protein [Spartinivicinus sp. A2-2]
MISSFILRFLATKLVKKIVLTLLKEMAKRTDNKIDDAIVAIVEKEALND